MLLRTVCSTCRSQWLPAFAPRLTPPQCLPLCQRCSCRGTRVLPSTSWHAGNVSIPFTPPEAFLAWYRNRLRFGPLLLAACTHSRASPHLLSHSQAPHIRCLVHIRLPVVCPALSPLTCPRLMALSRLGGAQTLSCKCPGNSNSPR